MGFDRYDGVVVEVSEELKGSEYICCYFILIEEEFGIVAERGSASYSRLCGV